MSVDVPQPPRCPPPKPGTSGPNMSGTSSSFPFTPFIYQHAPATYLETFYANRFQYAHPSVDQWPLRTPSHPPSYPNQVFWPIDPHATSTAVGEGSQFMHPNFPTPSSALSFPTFSYSQTAGKMSSITAVQSTDTTRAPVEPSLSRVDRATIPIGAARVTGKTRSSHMSDSPSETSSKSSSSLSPDRPALVEPRTNARVLALLPKQPCSRSPSDFLSSRTVNNLGPAGANGLDQHDAEQAISDRPGSRSERLDKAPPGRPSLKSADALAQGFADLDNLLKRVSDDTGLTSSQIVQRWRPPDSRPLNLWNIYQKYFQANSATEVRRLPESTKGGDSVVSTSTIRRAYTAFCKEEPNHEAILRLFWRIEEVSKSNTTLNSRSRRFQRYVQKLRRLADSASATDGFETVVGVAGAVVHQDQSLSAVFCSPMVSNFFSDRLRIPDDEFEGHLKAHAYDCSSRNSLAGMMDQTSLGSTTRSSSNAAAVDPPKKKSKNEMLLREIKDRFLKLTKPCKIPELQQSRTPFTHLPKLLAQEGWVLENWPEDVPFPCDIPKGKGIAKLPICYRQPLLSAFDDPHHSLKVVKRYSGPIPHSEPAIVGVPPPPGSKYSHARRKFLDENLTEDRKGPSSRVNPSSNKANANNDIHPPGGVTLKRRPAKAGASFIPLGREPKRMKPSQ